MIYRDGSRRFNMLEAKPYHFKWIPDVFYQRRMDHRLRRKKKIWRMFPTKSFNVGVLTWISLIAHPDIAFASHYLGKFSVNLGHKRWKAALHVLHYLSRTHLMQLVLGGKSKL